jgi:hypothetical protein
LEFTWSIFFALVIIGGIVARIYRRTLKVDADARSVPSLRLLAATNDADVSDAQRRAKRIPGRTQASHVSLEIIASAGQNRDANAYRAGYEMIIRGLQVTLEMQEISLPSGGFGTYGMPSIPSVVSRMTYTTEAFIPHLRAVNSLETFGLYAPFRPDRRITLAVHPDDLSDAYALLCELNIRLSVLHHPDQHWWKSEDE